MPYEHLQLHIQLVQQCIYLYTIFSSSFFALPPFWMVLEEIEIN